MRVIYVGCVIFSGELLQALIGESSFELVGLVTKEASSFNSDFINLSNVVELKEDDIFIYDSKKKDDLASWVSSKSPDIIYCFGWPHLLSRKIIKTPPKGAVGYHPASLPLNRGRHPIIWTLCLGLKEAGSTFFFLEDEADAGGILSQEFVSVHDDDYSRDLYQRLMFCAKKQIIKLNKQISLSQYQVIPQDHSIANHWRKRSYQDGKIDWRMSAQSIYNLVRALSFPYPYSFCEIGGNSYSVRKVKVILSDQANIEPGKIMYRVDRSIAVKCGVDALEVIDHDIQPLPQKGDYL